MSADGSTKAIVAAMVANAGIAITKFIAFLLSGATSMLAESVHSVADTTNQVLLLVGKRRAMREADEEHPFGYGRSRYVYAFIVAIILFSLGGLFAIYEGIEKLRNPHPLDPNWWWLPFVVLVVAIGLEWFSLATAVRESNKVRGRRSWIEFVRRAKSPELPVVLLEDVGAMLGLVFALVGVGLTQLTGDGIWDGIATLAIGALLVVIAVILGIEMGSLLVGEGANRDDVARIRATIARHAVVDRVIHLKTLYIGPEELMVGAKVAVSGRTAVADLAPRIDALEADIRAVVPAARIISIEPDVWRPDLATHPDPPTDAIILQSEN